MQQKHELHSTIGNAEDGGRRMGISEEQQERIADEGKALAQLRDPKLTKTLLLISRIAGMAAASQGTGLGVHLTK